MTFIAVCLLGATGSACFVIVVLFGALYDLAGKRNADKDRADSLEAEADALQAELNAALGRLSRKRKPLVEAEQAVAS